MLKFKKKNRWEDQDEYTKARNAYEGEAAAATKSAWALGFALFVVAGIAGVNTLDKHDLANLGNLKMVVLETSRTTGDVVSINMVDGELALPETGKRKFLEYWIELLRNVPNDQPAYARAFLQAQAYAVNEVNDFLLEIEAKYPVAKFIQAGGSREASVTNVTPLDNGMTYEIEWQEINYKQNRPVGNPVPMKAYLDLIQSPPLDDKQADANPLGMYIGGIRWTPQVSAMAP